MQSYLDTYRRFLASDRLSAKEKEELLAIEQDDNELRARFSSYLSFGTAGLRGVMKLGTNAMNTYTVAHATEGLAALIAEEGGKERGVAVAYDSRNNSRHFAEVASAVLASNGIRVFLFNDLRPTPELSFALRKLGCIAGINITASHNPKEYNGYKAYWEDGAQLAPEQADVVADKMAKTDIFDDVKLELPLEKVLSGPLVTILDERFDEYYLDEILKERVNPSAIADADDLKIVYTPLHGAGTRLVPETLRRAGLKHLYVVPSQEKPDGEFPTTPKPNPEYPQVFEPGEALANEVGSDLLLATDPDADRVGVMARAKDGKFYTISGNQMGCLLLDYIITAYEEGDGLPESAYAVKTIVSTELASTICKAHGVTLHNVLTGFKFIGEVIKNYEAKGYGTYLLGFEESYGYLKGTYARDKDAVSTSLLIVEMAAYYKKKHMTLIDALDRLYERYGYAFEKTGELYIEGLDGAEKIAAILENLRRDPPASFCGSAVLSIGDYRTGLFTDVKTGETTPTNLPKSNVLYYKTESGDVVVVRPSGTEPKIKFYYLLTGENKAACEAKLASAEATVKEYTGNH